jgi:hypothetical protein
MNRERGLHRREDARNFTEPSAAPELAVVQVGTVPLRLSDSLAEVIDDGDVSLQSLY